MPVGFVKSTTSFAKTLSSMDSLGKVAVKALKFCYDFAITPLEMIELSILQDNIPPLHLNAVVLGSL